MPLSPREVETKQFLTVLRGFDVDEVRAFLTEVADEMRLLVQALYAATPPDDALDQPDLDDLVRHGSAVSAEVVRMAEVGRAARIDADAVLRDAESESKLLQSSAAERRLSAVREAGRLIKRAQEEADAILAAAHRRDEEMARRLAELEDQLAHAEQAVRGVRSQVNRAVDNLTRATPPAAEAGR